VKGVFITAFIIGDTQRRIANAQRAIADDEYKPAPLIFPLLRRLNFASLRANPASHQGRE